MKEKKKKNFAVSIGILLGIILIFLLFFLNLLKPTQNAEILEKDNQSMPIKTKLYISDCNPGSLPFLVAQEQGYFQAEEIIIEAQNITNEEYRQNVGSLGEEDLIIAGRLKLYMDEVINPDQIRIFSTSYLDREHPTWAIIVKKDSGIKELKQLEGKKVGLEKNSGLEKNKSLSLMLRGIDIQKVDIQKTI